MTIEALAATASTKRMTKYQTQVLFFLAGAFMVGGRARATGAAANGEGLGQLRLGDERDASLGERATAETAVLAGALPRRACARAASSMTTNFGGGNCG